MNRKGSDLLNGFWEEGYHYYLEFNGRHLTVRDYRRAVCLETEVSYDVRALERGERTVISLKDNVLSRTAAGEPFTMIRELAYENGELKFLYYYTIMGETLYTLKKKDHGPFDHIRIRDDEFLKGLQGKWQEWTASGNGGTVLTIRGDRISIFGEPAVPFHAVTFSYEPDEVYLVPGNLIDSNFPGFTRFRVLPDRLTATMIVCDMSMPLSVFARPEKIKDLDVPDEARRPAVNVMTRRVDPPMVDVPPIKNDDSFPSAQPEKKRFCPGCGYAMGDPCPAFCPECGTKLK